MRKCKYCPRTFCGQRALKAHELECGGNEESFEENVVSSPITLEELNKRIEKLEKRNSFLENKVEKLEKKIDKLGKHASNQIKNIKITDWLNDNHKSVDFDIWKQSWEVTNEEMEYLIENKYVAGVFNIFKDNLQEEKPMRSFKKRSNDIFIYTQRKWRKMTDKDFSSLMTNTQCKIAGAVLKWQQLHPEIVNNNTNGKFEKAMIEAFGGPREKEHVNRDIRKKLFDYIKLELKNIQTYEFS
jgi:uncharacterized coiled-coil protein SlyX